MARAGEHGHEQLDEGRIDVHECLPDVEEDRAEPHVLRIAAASRAGAGHEITPEPSTCGSSSASEPSLSISTSATSMPLFVGRLSGHPAADLVGRQATIRSDP